MASILIVKRRKYPDVVGMWKGRERMRVVEVETQDHQKRYVVIDDTGKIVDPIVRYLKVLPAYPVEQARSNRTINHTLTVVRSFYDYHWRMEEVSTNLKDKTTTSLPGRFRRYKGFLHHISKGSPLAKNMLRQKDEKRQRPPTVTKDQVQELLNACTNERDRLLVRLLYETAMRVGESLALFVEDIDVAENRIHIRDRGELENGAEIKTIHASRALDVSSDLIDEVVAYVGRVHTAEVETNHLFIKLHGQRSGQALTYADVDSLFRRLRQKTGRQHVTPHVLRHTMLTTLAELGWQPELLQERAGHASFQQTYQIYVHPSQEALRAAWVQTQDQVCLTSSPQGYKKS